MLKKIRGKRTYLNIFVIACLFGTSIGFLSAELSNHSSAIESKHVLNNIETSAFDTKASRSTRLAKGYTTDGNHALVYDNVSIIDDTSRFGNSAVSINENIVIGVVKGSINSEALALFDTTTSGSARIVSSNYQSISDIYFDANLNILLAIVKTGSQYYINSYKLNENNDLSLTSSKLLFNNSDVPNATSLKIFKIANADSYMVTTKTTKSTNNRNYCQLWADTNGITRVSKTTITDNDTTEYILMAAGFAWTNSTNVSIQLLTTNYNTYILKAFKNGTCVSTFNLSQNFNGLQFDISDVNVKPFSDIVLNTDSNGVSATLLIDGIHSSIINMYFNLQSGVLGTINSKYRNVDPYISLDNDIDIDITRAFYLNNSIFFVSNNWRNPWDNPIIENYVVGVLNLDNINGTNSSNALNTTTLISSKLEGNRNPRLKFIRFFPTKVAFNISDKLSIVPMTNASYQTGDISLYGTTSEKTSLWKINQERDNHLGSFSYQTGLVDPNYTHIDADYTDARLITNKEINVGFKSQILDLFKGYSTAGEIIIEKVPNQNDLWLLGKLPINITFNKGYNELGQPAVINQQITLTGFKIIPTSILNNGILFDESLSNISANEYNITRITAYLNNQSFNIFDNLPDEATINVIENSLVYNLNNGSISMKIAPSSYIDETGELVDNENLIKQFDFTLSGFMKYSEQSTSIPSNITLNSLNTILASDAQNFVDEIKYEIVFNNIVENIANNQTLITDDIEITFNENSANNVTGKIEATITIKNGKYWENGQVIDSKTKVITISGFRIQNATEKTATNTLVNNFWNQYYAGEMSTEQYENYLNANINTLFENVPNNANIKIVDRITNVTLGEEGLTIKLDKWYDERGILQTNLNNSPRYSIKISGFKTDNLTTNIPTSMELPLSAILPSDILDSSPDYNMNINFLKQMIINSNQITNIANNQVISTNDLQIDVIPESIDNINGVANIELTILNNKVWLNGVIQNRYTQTIILSGFNSQQPTQQKNNSYRNSNWININSQSFTAQNINTLLNQQKDYFVENLPTDAYLSVVENEIEYNLGYILCSFTIDKYFDQKGILQTTNLPKYNIMLTGFKTNTSSTTIADEISMPMNYKNILASDIEDNMVIVIEDIINSGAIANTNGYLATDDVEYQVMPGTANNALCKVQVEVIVKNNKYLVDGVPQFAFSKIVTLNGFKEQKPTNTDIAFEFHPTGTTIKEQIEELKQQLDNNPMVPDSEPYYIPDANGDNIINSSDFIIEVVDGVIVFKPIYIYDENGMKVENIGSSSIHININKVTNDTPPKTSSTKLSKVHWLIIIIVSSVVGLMFLILIMWLIFRSRRRIYYEDGHYDVDYEDYYR